MLPEMIRLGVVSTGFAARRVNLAPLLGKDDAVVRQSLRRLLPTESGVARGALARFLALRPGDVIALKSHSAPKGSRPRLVIARYAVVSGDALPRYRRDPNLGHTFSVDFLAAQESIEFPFGYGRTIHEVSDKDRLEAIFGAYPGASQAFSETHGKAVKSDRPTHVSSVSRGEYVMRRVHNELQNELRKRLEQIHGHEAVTIEDEYVDLAVALDNRYLLFEVKSCPSPMYCLREALGQMLYYAWNNGRPRQAVKFFVVGPTKLQQSDAKFLDFLRSETGLSIDYCRPRDYGAE